MWGLFRPTVRVLYSRPKGAEIEGLPWRIGIFAFFWIYFARAESPFAAIDSRRRCFLNYLTTASTFAAFVKISFSFQLHLLLQKRILFVKASQVTTRRLRILSPSPRTPSLPIMPSSFLFKTQYISLPRSRLSGQVSLINNLFSNILAGVDDLPSFRGTVFGFLDLPAC